MSFRPNRSLGRQLRKDPAVVAALVAAAEVVRDRAQEIATEAGEPWMPRKRSRDVIVVGKDGAKVQVVNTDHAGHLVEWGSKNNPPRAPLRRGARAAGLRLEEQDH